MMCAGVSLHDTKHIRKQYKKETIMVNNTDTNPTLVLDTNTVTGIDHAYWPKHIRIEQSRYIDGMDPDGILALEMFDNDTNEDWATMSVNLTAYGRGAFPPTHDDDWAYTYIKDEYLPFIVALENAGIAQINGQVLYGPYSSIAWLVKFDVTKIGNKDDVNDIIPLYQYVSNHISSHCISSARVEINDA